MQSSNPIYSQTIAIVIINVLYSNKHQRPLLLIMNLILIILTCIIIIISSREGLALFNYVTIKNGTLKGMTTIAVYSGNFIYSYTRIPYAKPPVGHLRFKDPQPAVGWGNQILDARMPSLPCPQPMVGVDFMEDCLYLNVFTRKAGRNMFTQLFGNLTSAASTTSDEKLLPVIVYIYGGGFVMGDNMYYSGHKLLTEEIVLVVPNYRVGILGFLSTGDKESPGNYGLKDQTMALRWVKENIKAFGGDPNRVTLCGESAGASAAALHLLSPLSRGLFQKLILQSGSPISPWVRHKKPFEAAQRIAGMLKCPNSTSSEIMTCLRKKSAFRMSQVTPKLVLYDGGAALATHTSLLRVETLQQYELAIPGVTPVVEPDLPGAFIKEDPYEILRNGIIPDIPVIMGSCLTEGSLIFGIFHYFNFGSEPSLLDDPVFVSEELVRTLSKSVGVSDPILEETLSYAYMPVGPLKSGQDAIPGLVDMMGVIFNKGSILRTANILSRRIKSPVYLYSFEQTSRHSIWHILWPFMKMAFGGTIPDIDHGIMHADDVMYLFPMPFMPSMREITFSKTFIKMWADFVTTGNPTPHNNNASYPKWPRYNTRNQFFYRLKSNATVDQDYRKVFRRPYY